MINQNQSQSSGLLLLPPVSVAVYTDPRLRLRPHGKHVVV